MKKMVIMAIGMLMAGSVGATENTSFMNSPYMKCLTNLNNSIVTETGLKNLLDTIDDVSAGKLNADINIGIDNVCKQLYIISPTVSEKIKGFCLSKNKGKNINNCISSTKQAILYSSPDNKIFIEWLTKEAKTYIKSYQNAINQLNEKSGVTVSK